MGQPFRWGILGTANIARVAVAPAVAAAEGAELAAVASREAGRAEAFARALGVPRWHGSYEALLDDPEVDGLYIPLPNSLHREWTVRAVGAGKHVLCEKPLAATESQCREMDAAAREAGVTLMEAFMYRFHPRTERLLALVRDGAVGRVGAIRSAFTFRLTRPGNIRLDPELAGGALMDVGCYCVNVSRTVAGAEPEAVRATARWTSSGVDGQLTGVLHFPDDVVAHFDCALTLERWESVEVAGEEGLLRLPSAFLPGTGDAVIEEYRGRERRPDHVVAGVDQYRLMVEHFVACARSGARPRWDAAEAALNLRTLEALYRSVRWGGATVEVAG